MNTGADVTGLEGETADAIKDGNCSVSGRASASVRSSGFGFGDDFLPTVFIFGFGFGFSFPPVVIKTCVL